MVMMMVPAVSKVGTVRVRARARVRYKETRYEKSKWVMKNCCLWTGSKRVNSFGQWWWAMLMSAPMTPILLINFEAIFGQYFEWHECPNIAQSNIEQILP